MACSDLESLEELVKRYYPRTEEKLDDITYRPRTEKDLAENILRRRLCTAYRQKATSLRRQDSDKPSFVYDTEHRSDRDEAQYS